MKYTIFSKFPVGNIQEAVQSDIKGKYLNKQQDC